MAFQFDVPFAQPGFLGGHFYFTIDLLGPSLELLFAELGQKSNFAFRLEDARFLFLNALGLARQVRAQHGLTCVSAHGEGGQRAQVGCGDGSAVLDEGGRFASVGGDLEERVLRELFFGEELLQFAAFGFRAA